MDSVAVGFWGAFFGAVGLSLIAALMAFTRSARRVALTGSLSALVSVAYVVVFLGWIPVRDPDTLMRVQAHLAALSAAVLGLLLFRLLGLLRGRRRSATIVATVALTAGVIAGGWLLPPHGALGLAVLLQALQISLGLAGAVRSALRGAPSGWLALGGIACMSLTIACLTWHALSQGDTPWPVHAIGALAAIAYTGSMAAAMWQRYSYLIDVRQAMEHGPSFDPITRMPSTFETGLQVSEAFDKARGEDRPMGLVVVSIANLEALEQLHGRAAYNHGLFICASRLRRIIPAGVELGRVGDDAFLLMMRRPPGADALIELAQLVVKRLGRPVLVGTSEDMAALEGSRTEWVADVGVGLLVARQDMRPATALAAARAMSRTAWSYATRLATYDEDGRQIAELAAEAPVPVR